MCTILGHHISLIRPARVAVMRPGGKAWSGAKATGRKTRKLTLEMKQKIARQMGYKLASSACMRTTGGN